jgi:hypothetical protein
VGPKPEELDEQMSSAVHPCQSGGQPYFFKQLANRHDAHAAKIISFLQNYEGGVSVWSMVGNIWWGLLVFTDS